MSTVEEFYNRQWSSSKERKDAVLFLTMMSKAVRYSYRLLGDLRGKKILEVGCGSGDQAVYFARQGAKVTAIDISEVSLRHTRELALLRETEVKTQYMNAENMSFKNNSFDAVYINSTLMHVSQDQVFQECQRVLKKGGKLVIVEPLDRNPVLKLFRQFSVYRKMKPRYLNLLVFHKYGSLFNTYHHKEFYFSSILLLPVFTVIPVLGKCFWAVSSGADKLLLQVFPELGPWCWVSVVEYQK